MSSWTYSTLNDYYENQDKITYSPTAEQAIQLQKRNISLKTARAMLKEYCTYDNMLSQSDSELSVMANAYSKLIADGEASIIVP